MNTPLQKTKKNAEVIAQRNEVIAEAIIDVIGRASTRDDAIATQDTSPPVPPDPPHPSPLYPTEQYRALGIPYCTKCGEKARTGTHGEVICAIASLNCVRIKNG